jgi:hypothetical protein
LRLTATTSRDKSKLEEEEKEAPLARIQRATLQSSYYRTLLTGPQHCSSTDRSSPSRLCSSEVRKCRRGVLAGKKGKRNSFPLAFA